MFIDNSAVSVSPATVGAGPVEFIITNQAAQAESLAILRAGAAAGQPLANTGPINPQAHRPGDRQLLLPAATRSPPPAGAPAPASTIRAASIHIGAKRASSDNQLLQP